MRQNLKIKSQREPLLSFLVEVGEEAHIPIFKGKPCTSPSED